MQKRHKLLFSIMSSNYLLEMRLENQNLWLDQARLSLLHVYTTADKESFLLFALLCTTLQQV